MLDHWLKTKNSPFVYTFNHHEILRKIEISQPINSLTGLLFSPDSAFSGYIQQNCGTKQPQLGLHVQNEHRPHSYVSDTTHNWTFCNNRCTDQHAVAVTVIKTFWVSHQILCSTAHQFTEQFWNALQLLYFLLNLLWRLLIIVSSVTCHCLQATTAVQ